MKKLLPLFIILGVYLISTGISYALFSQGTLFSKKMVKSTPPKIGSNGMMFDQNLPKTESCPLNGVMYSKQQKDWWEQHRPLGVMIENHEEARPQSGISYADEIPD